MNHDFCGVKRPEFDTMTAKHTAAASQLDQLAQRLYGELSQAGLDVTPATRMRELAHRVRLQAEDLRRRQRLITELERQKIVFGACTPAGTFLPVPDGLDSAEAMLNGTLAALAASGGNVWPLTSAAHGAGDPAFAKALVTRLGAAGVVKLGAAPPQALQALSTALAVVTDPASPGYLGDGFLRQLVAAGRTPPHEPDPERPSGYHHLAGILAAHGGAPPYSAAFAKIVGRDMLAMDRQIWDARQAGEATPLMTNMRSFLPGLVHAAASAPLAAQTLLAHTPPGQKTPNLHYLLHERAGLWGAGTGPFGALLEAAMKGHDPVSGRLTAETIKILGTDVAACYERDDNERLKLKDQDAFDRIAALRTPLGNIFAAHIHEIGDSYNGLLVWKTTDGPASQATAVNSQDLDYALLFTVTDDTAFKKVVEAQAEHMRVELDAIFPLRPKGQDLDDPIAREGLTFGHLLAVREEGLLAEGRANAADAAALREMVRTGIGLIPVPGAHLAGEWAQQAFKNAHFGEYASSLADGMLESGKANGYDRAADWVAEQFKDGRTLDETFSTARSAGKLVTRLMEQMVASAIIAHGQFDPSTCEGQSFLESGRFRPLETLSAEQYQDLLDWASKSSHFSGYLGDAVQALHNASVEVRRDIGVNE